MNENKTVNEGRDAVNKNISRYRFMSVSKSLFWNTKRRFRTI